MGWLQQQADALKAANNEAHAQLAATLTQLQKESLERNYLHRDLRGDGCGCSICEGEWDFWDGAWSWVDADTRKAVDSAALRRW